MARKKKPKLSGNAVIYARYSSANQRDVSIEQQYDACEKYAKTHGYTIVDRYADRAISGTTDNRPAFKLMMSEAHSGKFDFVIAWKSNRMGRNMMQAMTNESILAQLGIRCLYVEEDFDDTAAGRFALRNMMNVNQFYSENLAEDVRRGMADNASKCMVNNLPPYGYRKGKDGKYEIDEDQAAIVREIYTRVLDGWSIYDIQTDLNNRGIKTGRGREWKKQSFGHILQNQKYTGLYQWADVVVEGGMPVIIDNETFEAVQNILRTKKKPRGKQRMNDEYILTGKLYCGHCGAPMTAQTGTSSTGKVFAYYSCNRKRYEHACDKKNVPKDVIEKTVMDFVIEQLMSDELIEKIVSGYETAVAQAKDEAKLLNLQAELKDVNDRLSNILGAIEIGIFNNTTQARMEKLEDLRKELEAAIMVEERANEVPSPDAVRSWLHSLRNGNVQDRQYQRQLILTFIKAIYVFDDTLRIQFNYGTESQYKYESDNESAFLSGTDRGTSCVLRELCFTAGFFEALMPLRR